MVKVLGVWWWIVLGLGVCEVGGVEGDLGVFCGFGWD